MKDYDEGRATEIVEAEVARIAAVLEGTGKVKPGKSE
jgi:hypothetical protein